MKTSLKYFMIVAKTMNVTNAAKQMFISPQSMSAHIKRAEKEFGVQLFERKPHFKLTPEGELLYRFLEKSEQNERDIKERLRNAKTGIEGTVRMGIDTTRGVSFLRDCYAELHKKYPHIAIEMINDFSPNLVPQVLNGTLHFMFGNYWYNSEDVEITPVCPEKYGYLLSDTLLKKYRKNNWQIVKEKMMQGVDLKDIQDIPVVLTAKESYMGQQIMRLFQENGATPNIIFTCNTHFLNFNMAASGVGACFCPDKLLRYAKMYMASYDGKANDLEYYPIKNLTEEHQLSIITRKDGYIPAYVQTVINCIVDAYSNNATIL